MRARRGSETAKSLNDWIAEATEQLVLLIVSRDSLQREVLPLRGEVVVGRDEEATVRVRDPSVSRLHAVIRIEDSLSVEDLESSNGTLWMGQRLQPNVRQIIRVGDTLRFGDTTAVLQRGPNSAHGSCSHGHFEMRVRTAVDAAAQRAGACAVVRISIPAAAATLAAEILAGTIGRSDALGEYGPEGTFEVLLAECSEEQASKFVKSITAAFTQHGIQAALGIARYGTDGRTAEELIAAACERVSGPTRPGAASEPVPPIDPAMQQVYQQVDRLASGNISILILGETGVGKEVLARQIHRRSRRAEKPLMSLNCGALTPTLLESELFGHEKGAFTGAARTKTGLLEAADGGTVFLDEVFELPIDLQVKLLRVLEDQKVMRVGSTEERAIDVRIISATNRKPDVDIAAGRLREDLYYRLAGATVVIPPLRARPGEIVPLAECFVRRVCERDGRLPCVLADAAKAVLTRYAWPGNVRELRNAVERAVLLADGGRIEPQHLPLEKMVDEPKPDPSGATGRQNTTMVTEEHTHAAVWKALRAPDVAAEREALLHALNECGGNQRRAAELLGISRGTLIARMIRYDIPRPRKK